MRILYFSASYGPHDHRFLSTLASTAHSIFFVQLAKDERHEESRPVPTRIEQVPWVGGRREFRWRDVPRLRRDLKRVVDKVQPDLIHAGPIQTCAFLAILTGFRPVLTMSWGFDLMQDAEKNPWWRWVTRYTLRRSSYFVSDARVTRAKAVSHGMRSGRTEVFPWGVDLGLFRPGDSRRRGERKPRAKPRRTLGSPRRSEQPFVILCNRSWEPRYGVDVLAKAFVSAAQKNSSLSLILLGGGSQASTIRELLTEGRVTDRVYFGGQVSQADLPRWYQMADLFVSPSHIDGSSVSLLEALACGRPVLVSDIPANKEWVRENINGWLFPDGNVDALAERILGISARRSVLPRIGRAARRVAEERANWDRNFAVLLRIYRRAVRSQ